MKKLVAVLDRIDAGSEEAVRETLQDALGLWASAHGVAVNVVAVSEQSVAFADDQDNLWVGHHNMIGERVVLTDMKKILNITEEVSDMSFLDEISEQFVSLVSENQEDKARDLVGLVLEYKQKVVRKGKAIRINDPATARRNYRKKSYSARWHTEQAARKTAKKTAHKATKAIRQAKSMKRRKLLGLGPNKGGAAGHKHTNEGVERKELAILEALEQLVPTVAELIAVTESMNRAPVIEGKIHETGDKGIFSIKTKGGENGDKTSAGRLMTTPWGVAESLDPADETILERTHSTGIKVNVAGMDGVDDGEYELQKGNSRSCHLVKRGEKGGEHTFHKLPTKLIRKGIKAAAKATNEDVEAAEQALNEALAEMHKTDAGKGVVLVNVGSIKEQFSTKDFMFRAALAWDGFRASPVSEELGAKIKGGLTAEEIVSEQPMLLLCTEQEVYDAIHKFFESLDPNDITAKAKEITAIAESDDGKAQISEFLSNFQDGALIEAIEGTEQPLSEQMDDLLLEAPKFDFGAADDLGEDNLDDDQDTEGMDDESGMGEEDDLDDEGMDDDMGGEGDMDDDMGGDDTVTMEISASELREKLNGILDIIGDEIEDSEEFDELRSQIEDEESELDSDILTRTLEVVNDYFDAVGKSAEKDQEGRQEEEMGDETLDDMGDLDDEGGQDDGEGSGTDFGGGEEGAGGDLELGQ